MFSNAKVGDRVWDFIEHWGTIIRIHDKSDFPLIIKFDNKEERIYKFNGQAYGENMTIRLFWNEIKFEIPEKSFDLKEELKKLEIVKFKNKKLNYFLYYDNDNNSIRSGYNVCEDAPFFIFFSSESICNFLNKIKDKEITKEEFFTAYINVFGETK